MSVTLRIILLIISVITFFFVVGKVRKCQLEIVDSVVWILLVMLMVLMVAFSPFVEKISRALGFISTSNFVFAFILFVLLIIVFIQSVKISLLNDKIKNLNHYLALKENENSKKINKIR